MAHCQFKVTGWGIVFNCDMVLRCAGNLISGLSLDHAVTVDLTATVVHSYTSLTKDVTHTNYVSICIRFTYSFDITGT